MFKKLIYKLIDFLLKVIKHRGMTDSIDKVVENKVLSYFSGSYRPKITMNRNETITSIVYELEFPDLKKMMFKIEYLENDLKVYFVSSDIEYLDVLSEELNKLNQGFKTHGFEILQYFRTR